MFETEKSFPRSDTALLLVLKQRDIFSLLLGGFGGDSALVQCCPGWGRCLWGFVLVLLAGNRLRAGAAGGRFMALAGTERW